MKRFESMELIINKSDKLKPIHKISEITITMAFWFIVLYLWQPILSLIAWSFGINWYYQHMVTLGGSEHLLNTLFNYLQVILTLGFALILWALSNKIRFKNKTRRSRIKPVTAVEIAEQFRVNIDVLDSLLKADNVNILINQEFDITATINATNKAKERKTA